jgi:hypothetical protein
VTTSTRPIVRCEQRLPDDRLLRRAARKAVAEGLAWDLVVAVPPPSMGLPLGKPLETLVVEGRAAQRHGLRLKWGRWIAEELVVHYDDGRVVHVSGDVLRRSVRSR